jgi:hypothetical protein
MTPHTQDAPTAVPSPTGMTPNERRRTPRRRVLKEGKLIFAQAQSVVDCTIDNASEGGAHVRITSSQGVPQEFYLVEASRGVIHKAEVAWRTTTGMGLKTLGSVDDAAARESLLRKFRRG